MELTRKYVAGLSLLLAAIGLEAFLLYADLQKLSFPLSPIGRPSVAVPRPIGLVSLRKGILAKRRQDRYSWYRLREKDPFYPLDTLMTGPNSTARAWLRGVGEVVLDSDTIVTVTELSSLSDPSGVGIDLGQGRVTFFSQKAPAKLRTRTHDIRLGSDTELSITKPIFAEAWELEVKQGNARVETSGKKEGALDLKPGQAVLVQSGKKMGRIETNLQITQHYPKSNERLYSQRHLEKVVFSWDGDVAEVIEIDSLADFSSSRRLKTRPTNAEVELPHGKYFWRVRREFVISPAFEFTILPAAQYRLKTPEDGSVQMGKDFPPFEWEPIEGAGRYKLEVSESPSFGELALKLETPDTKVSGGSLKAGNYFWRVKAIHPEWGEWPFSNASRFRIKAGKGSARKKAVPE